MTVFTRMAAPCAVCVVLVLTGCNPPGAPLPPLDKSQIVIMVSVKPVADNVGSGPTAYSAFCTFSSASGPGVTVDVGSAIVRVNGVTLPNVPSVGPNFFRALSALSLDTGDAVTLDITESRLGSIHAGAAVPASVTSFTLVPPIPAHGLLNTATSYAMSWTASGADVYTSSCSFYDGTSTGHGGFGVITPSTSFTFSSSHPDWDAANQSYLEFTLETQNEGFFTEFHPASLLKVSGVTRVTQDNVP